MNPKPNIFAVASVGGHWVQLLRITHGLEADFDIVYGSTHPKCAAMVPDCHFVLVRDFSRWDAWKMPVELFRLIRIIRREQPDAVVSTGAAPGLTALLAAKLCRKKTLWVDSIANAAHLSMCGKIATHFADRVYTQWELLADGMKIIYKGNILE